MKTSFKNEHINILRKSSWLISLAIVCSIGSFAWGQNSDVQYPEVISIQVKVLNTGEEEEFEHVGTGFFYSKPDIIVTAFHVIEHLFWVIDNLFDDRREGSLKDYISLYHRPQGNPIPVKDIEIIALDAKYDLAVLKIKGYQSDTFYSSHPNTDLRSLELDSEIKVVGFPKHNLTEQSILKGLTSGDANYDYPGSGSFIGFVHDKNIPTHGMSGGPVFLASDNSVLGVIIEGKFAMLFEEYIGLDVFVSVNKLQLMLQKPSLSCGNVFCVIEEFKNLEKQAIKGDIGSQYRLGVYLQETEKMNSILWLERAARAGHPNAQYILGVNQYFFLDNKQLLWDPKVPKCLSSETDNYWLKSSADQGFYPAQIFLKRIEAKSKESCKIEFLLPLKP